MAARKAKVPSSVPSSRIDLGTRVSAVADLVGGRRRLSEIGGVHVDQIYRYIRGENSPSVEILTKICAMSGVSIRWLATGEGPMRQGDLAAEVAESRPAYGTPVDVKDLPRERFCLWLRQWWDRASDDEKAWMRIQLERSFPEFGEWLKKTGPGSSSGQSSA